MLVIPQNELRVIEINELILVIKGGQYDQEVEIRPIDSCMPLATYYNKKRAIEVLRDFVAARKRVYKLEHAKDLLSPEEINTIIDKDYVFVFPNK